MYYIRIMKHSRLAAAMLMILDAYIYVKNYAYYYLCEVMYWIMRAVMQRENTRYNKGKVLLIEAKYHSYFDVTVPVMLYMMVNRAATGYNLNSYLSRLYGVECGEIKVTFTKSGQLHRNCIDLNTDEKISFVENAIEWPN